MQNFPSPLPLVPILPRPTGCCYQENLIALPLEKRHFEWGLWLLIWWGGWDFGMILYDKIVLLPKTSTDAVMKEFRIGRCSWLSRVGSHWDVMDGYC